MDTIKNAANYVSDKAQSKFTCPAFQLPSSSTWLRLGQYLTDFPLTTGATASASKETNKSVAKDSDVPVSSRVSAGVDALGDKKDEKKHDISAEGNKQAATH
jgi:hypothetical protein